MVMTMFVIIMEILKIMIVMIIFMMEQIEGDICLPKNQLLTCQHYSLYFDIPSQSLNDNSDDNKEYNVADDYMNYDYYDDLPSLW